MSVTENILNVKNIMQATSSKYIDLFHEIKCVRISSHIYANVHCVYARATCYRTVRLYHLHKLNYIMIFVRREDTSNFVCGSKLSFFLFTVQKVLNFLPMADVATWIAFLGKTKLHCGRQWGPNASIFGWPQSPMIIAVHISNFQRTSQK